MSVGLVHRIGSLCFLHSEVVETHCVFVEYWWRVLLSHVCIFFSGKNYFIFCTCRRRVLLLMTVFLLIKKVEIRWSFTTSLLLNLLCISTHVYTDVYGHTCYRGPVLICFPVWLTSQCQLFYLWIQIIMTFFCFKE